LRLIGESIKILFFKKLCKNIMQLFVLNITLFSAILKLRFYSGSHILNSNSLKMISYLEGKILKKSEKSAILLVGGVGYKLFMPVAFLAKLELGGEAEVFTYLNVKEDALDLYGFSSESELELFELLISISGVGPRAALSIVSLDSPEKIVGAILREDFAYLSSVSGIGAKTGKKIVLELKDKVAKLSFEAESTESASSDAEVIDALEALGYSPRDARDAVRNISKETEGVEKRIREALKILGKK